MSRWLQSVNNILENLDGTAENVANEPLGIPTSRGAVGKILAKRGLDYDGEEEDYDEEGEYDEDEYEDEDDEGDDQEEEDQEIFFTPAQQPKQQHDDFIMTPRPSEAKEKTDRTEGNPSMQTTHPDIPREGSPEESDASSGIMVEKPEGEKLKIPPRVPSRDVLEVVSPPRSAQFALPTPPISGTPINTDKMQQQLKKLRLELKKSQTETRQLRKHVMGLNKELEASEGEVKAQREELERAAERMEKERQRSSEDREDLLDEQEEELETQKAELEKELQDQKERYEDQLDELEERLASLDQQRAQEGGDWTKELEDSLSRERDAIKKVSALKDENAKLKSSVDKVETQRSALQSKLDSMAQANQTTNERVREAEDKLDAALSLHSRQLTQRQSREAELESTISDLGAALARSRQKEKSAPLQRMDQSAGEMKEKFVMVVDELETARAQLSLETERCEALRTEIADISKERTAEATEAQARQRQHNREVTDLQAKVSRLQAAQRERSSAVESTSDAQLDTPELQAKLEAATEQVRGLSQQLLGQQNNTQNAKQEIFTLKNRLQSATSRAETAEMALAEASSSRGGVYEVDGGVAYSGGTMRRRVKGGRSKGNTSVRSVRTALGMSAGRGGDGMEQFAVTVDAMDSFLLETGSFLRQEPLARVGLVLYLCILHLWSFCLVIFHASTYETVHGDFGSMNDPAHGGAAPLLRNSHN